MEALPKSRLLRFVERTYHLSQQAVARYSSKFSKRRYTLHQHIVLLCLQVRKNTTYRTLLDERIETPRIATLSLLRNSPSPSTLCESFNRFDMAVWRVLLNLSVTLLPTNDGIDTSGFGFSGENIKPIEFQQSPYNRFRDPRRSDRTDPCGSSEVSRSPVRTRQPRPVSSQTSAATLITLRARSGSRAAAVCQVRLRIFSDNRVIIEVDHSRASVVRFWV
ncbi:hypothetical protein SAMN04488556_1462 [Halostagnicola kamekurae]|uniref:Transposase n=1 Tax=Halostagnicola kamekurae TaxID=619731 RepID=A0A1I6QQT1_9EURY|nr:hypothetical protein SAMN04488556_1462 [Halostagnicola kamekurae]